ncbi:hypothetical protein, conserved [Eimeria tenella]|uniref:AB hydrolase-1 domain-containing protein n=1 Tax=Eimeria tenella TaxID=5802 RepID=U6KNQ5_EIMTE|nr:hypothetical protein, conserved [Eimeria tenella]CDJ39752.1 hypothetical protein, conserved [Eimeria tenella]|eukprot:XP_013230505.1 hypothetical protein, conserved [Eimeria tenella]
MGEDRLLALCGGCAPLAAESKHLGLQFASVGPWKFRVVTLDSQGPLRLLGDTPESATALDGAPIEAPPPEAPPASKDASISSSKKGISAFFVHGLCGRAGQFQHQLHYLAQRGVRCIAPDLPGHGLSTFSKGAPGAPGAPGVPGAPRAWGPLGPPPAVCPLEDTEAIIKATFDSLAGTRSKEEKPQGPQGPPGPQKPQGAPWGAVLVGHSSGCELVLELYRQLVAEGRGGEVKGICLIGGDAREGVKLDLGFCWLLLQLPRLLLQLLRWLLSLPSQRLLYGRETRKENPQLIQHEKLINAENPLNSILPILNWFKRGERRKEFLKAAAAYRDSSSRPPVLLLYGEEDSVCAAYPAAAAVSRALGAAPISSTPLPGPSYLRLPYTACAVETPGGASSSSTACSSSSSSSSLHASPELWGKQGALTVAVVGRAGHSVMLEQPLEVNRILWDFVRQQLNEDPNAK